MLQKTADKLGSVQADGAQAVAFGFAIAKKYPTVFDLDDSAVADGHFKYIGGKILQTGRRATHGLTVDHPVCLPDIGRDQIIKACSDDLIAELGGIDFRHGFYGQEKGPLGRMPRLIVFGQGTAGNDIMDVRVVLQLAAPGVQNTQKAGQITADVFFIGGQLFQGLR